jgi:hypothetical protein
MAPKALSLRQLLAVGPPLPLHADSHKAITWLNNRWQCEIEGASWNSLHGSAPKPYSSS